MSIFGKKFGESDAGSFDLTSSANQSPQTSFESPKAKTPRYTIDQAIALVSSLKEQNVSSRVVAAIIKQTLESVNIHFADIIDDARHKESAINIETSKKDEMIRDLTRKVEMLQNEKVGFQKELERTVYVREFLQQAVEDQQAAGNATAKTPPAARKPSGNAVHPAGSVN